jgi:uncharacterized protein
MSKAWIAGIAAACLLFVGCAGAMERTSPGHPIAQPRVAGVAAKIVAGARLQLLHPAEYTGEYFSIPYPNGDVPKDRGACVDVVIRALRNAGYDLQKLIHEDMKKNLKLYPRHGDRPDSNIDHRRVPNQRFFFSRFGQSLSISKDWRPGDIVTWKLDSGLDHTGVLSDKIDPDGLPFVIHNLSRTAEEDVLKAWQITGHYRYPVLRH